MIPPVVAEVMRCTRRKNGHGTDLMHVARLSPMLLLCLLSSDNFLKGSQGVKNTRLKNLLAMAEAFFCPHQGTAQVREVLAAQVFQLTPFE